MLILEVTGHLVIENGFTLTNSKPAVGGKEGVVAVPVESRAWSIGASGAGM